jgi:hypothetical protein
LNSTIDWTIIVTAAKSKTISNTTNNSIDETTTVGIAIIGIVT